MPLKVVSAMSLLFITNLVKIKVWIAEIQYGTRPQNLFSVFTFIFLLGETSYILELLYNSTYCLNLAFQYFEGPSWPKGCNLKLEKM